MLLEEKFITCISIFKNFLIFDISTFLINFFYGNIG